MNEVTKNTKSTPLNIASQKGHLAVVEVLTNAGADFKIGTNDGTTPLHSAAQEVSNVLTIYGSG